mmetsp:Transcript_6850/g.16212  ORF Transcript_6850/g.16212 Transcript_6850/m.16212 type:complete len:200 (+) Transcript_6850:1662-2261(+)
MAFSSSDRRAALVCCTFSCSSNSGLLRASDAFAGVPASPPFAKSRDLLLPLSLVKTPFFCLMISTVSSAVDKSRRYTSSRLGFASCASLSSPPSSCVSPSSVCSSLPSGSCSAWVLVGRMGCSSTLCRIAISSLKEVLSASISLNFSRLCSGSLLTTISSTCWKLSEPESFWSPSLRVSSSLSIPFLTFFFPPGRLKVL